MATLYLDFTNGNDSNNGTSFANRVKTITSGITSARHAAGDTIRIMKSEDPVSLGVNATFTKQSDTVTLASGVTANIDLCNATWTGVAANVTQTTSTTRKEGANSLSLAIAAAFTTGQIAYKTISSTDFSAYTKVSFWIRANAAVSSGVLKLSLCSDTLGATPVNSFTINEALTANSWKCLTFDNGSALGSAIQSISFDAISDPGTVTILLDNIIACTKLTLTSLISLSSSATALDFWPVKSINGTTIKLDQGANHDASSTARGYSETTTTATCYKREPIRISASQSIQKSGTQASLITYSGGWNTTDMSTQTGATFIDFGDASNVVLSGNSFEYLSFEYLAAIRGTTGINNCYYSKLNYCASISPSSTGFAQINYCYISNSYAIAANGVGFSGPVDSLLFSCYAYSCNSVNYQNVYKAISCTSNNSASLGFTNGYMLINCSAKDNGGAGFNTCQYLISCTTSGNGSSVVSNYSNTFADNCTFSEAAFNTTSGRLTHSRIGNDPAVSRIYYLSTIIAQIAGSPVHGTTTKSWQHIPQTAHTSDNPFGQQLSPIAVASSGTFTFSIWVQRSSTNVGAGILLRGGQVSGVTSDVQVNMTAAINTWEQLTITASPTQAVPIVIELLSWQISGSGNVYFGDASVSQS